VRNRAAVRVVGPLDWVGFPALICALLSVAFATVVRFPGGFQLPEPIFPMLLAFAWPLIRPSMIGPVLLLALGLFEDLLLGAPLGLWALTLLGVYAGILATRHLIVGQDFRVLFGWWAGAVSCAYAAAYLMICLIDGGAPSLIDAAMQLGGTLALFPFANNLVQRFDDGDVRFR
jgi:rod shape-determining protein MreD